MKKRCVTRRIPALLVIPHVLHYMYRHIFKLFALFCGMSIMAASFSVPIAAQASEADVSPTSGGYSIFDETMADMTWPDVEQAGAIVLFPLAVIEEHGPHTPLGVDTYLATIQAKLLRRELESRGIQTLIAPPFY